MQGAFSGPSGDSGDSGLPGPGLRDVGHRIRVDCLVDFRQVPALGLPLGLRGAAFLGRLLFWPLRVFRQLDQRCQHVHRFQIHFLEFHD